MSRLHASKEKTAVNFGNVKDEVAGRILQASGFKRGEFLFRYLGMPIRARKLCKVDFDVIMDKILKGSVICYKK